MPAVYVAAGSNVAPERNLARAVAQLASEFPGTRFSSWYRNRAVGFEGEDFINLVAGFDTALPVHEVLGKLHAIEALCGRPRTAPRQTHRLNMLLGTGHNITRRSRTHWSKLRRQLRADRLAHIQCISVATPTSARNTGSSRLAHSSHRK